MRVFVAVLLIFFATGVGLLTYIAAGGRIADLVGEEVASYIPTSLWDDWFGGGDDKMQAETNPGQDGDSAAPTPEQPTSTVGNPEPAPEPSGQTGEPSQPTQIGGADGPQQLPAEDEGPFRLGLPMNCEYGRTCFIQNYVDMRGGDEYRDYKCGPLAYNRHRGTDFRVPSYVEMERGVTVVAAAPGTVKGVRDGLPDANYKLFGRNAVNDRALGNVVVLEHNDGFQTYYGHLKRDSILVEKGDRVARGQPLGQVGMSGLTEFPHLHLQVMNGKRVVDPFTSLTYEAGCGVEAESLWLPEVAAQLTYLRTMVLRVGFSNRELNKAAAEYDLFDKDRLSPRSKQLWFNAYVAGIGVGDEFEVTITDPDGQIFIETPGGFDRPAAVSLIKIGKESLDSPLKLGVYRASFKYFRNEGQGREKMFDVEREIEVR